MKEIGLNLTYDHGATLSISRLELLVVSLQSYSAKILAQNIKGSAISAEILSSIWDDTVHEAENYDFCDLSYEDQTQILKRCIGELRWFLVGSVGMAEKLLEEERAVAS